MSFSSKCFASSQQNQISSFLDGGVIYGNSHVWTSLLRSFKDGQLLADDDLNQYNFPAYNNVKLPLVNAPIPKTHDLKSVDRLLRKEILFLQCVFLIRIQTGRKYVMITKSFFWLRPKDCDMTGDMLFPYWYGLVLKADLNVSNCYCLWIDLSLYLNIFCSLQERQDIVPTQRI